MPLQSWAVSRAIAESVAGLSASWDDGPPLPVRVLPDGGADLLFSWPIAGGPVVAEVFGPKSAAVVVADAEPMEKIAVRLRPGRAARWFGVPARFLADHSVPLGDLWGREAWELGQRLAEAREPAARRALVERTLLERSRRVAEPVALVAAAVERIAGTGGRCSMQSLASALGVGTRHLERVFDEHVGLRPKLFARIVRLGRARSALARGASQIEAALGAGYADQAHLHRDCRALAGAPPSAFRPWSPIASRSGAGFVQD